MKLGYNYSRELRSLLDVGRTYPDFLVPEDDFPAHLETQIATLTTIINRQKSKS